MSARSPVRAGLSLQAIAVAVLLCLATTGLLTASWQAPSGVAPSAPSAARQDAEPWPDDEVIAERKRAAQDRPLFAAPEPVAFTLIADFKAVQRDRDLTSTTTYPATLVVARPDGTEASLALRIRTRGHSRRAPSSCDFAPLRLEFESNPLGTVFEGQKSLKLGTHCRDTADYEQYVLREYAVYQMFNVLTPRSFRARLGAARYVDVKSRKTVAASHGLFLEDDDDVARRLEGRATDQLGTIFRRTDLPTTTLMTIFAFMIGNTDMSISALHNVRLVRTRSDVLFPVPYDFDYSGVVNASYARPGPRLGLSSVRQRLYRGPCWTAQEFEPFLAHFRQARPAIEAVYRVVPNMAPGYVRQAQEYLAEFYGILDRPDRVQRAFIDKCDSRAGM